MICHQIDTDVSKMQAKYLKEAKARLQLQKSLASILTSIQDHCKDRNIIEESVIIALQAEARGKSIMTALDVVSLQPDVTNSDVSSDSEGSVY